MIQHETVDVLIASSGPAGMSAALHLIKADPGWAARMAVIEKAVHPREKLCGGGVTQWGEQVLSGLGLSFEPNHTDVQKMRLVCQHRVFDLKDDHAPMFRVVRRDEFDHWLVRCGERHGITIRQGEAVSDVIPRDSAVEVHTDRTVFHAKMVVAADGSNSIVRRKLKLPRLGKARTLEILTSETGQTAAFAQGIAEYDFTPLFKGLQGYCWNFPCAVQGKSCMSRGIFDSRICPERPPIPLKSAFQEGLAAQGQQTGDLRLRSFPIQCFDISGIFAVPRILFAGDAAGADPLFGEGISFALAYGDAAAQEIIQAFASRDFTCSAYKKRVFTHPVLKQLPLRTRAARVLYKLPQIPRLEEIIWDITPFIFKILARITGRPNMHIVRKKSDFFKKSDFSV